MVVTLRSSPRPDGPPPTLDRSHEDAATDSEDSDEWKDYSDRSGTGSDSVTQSEAEPRQIGGTTASDSESETGSDSSTESEPSELEKALASVRNIFGNDGMINIFIVGGKVTRGRPGIDGIRGPPGECKCHCPCTKAAADALDKVIESSGVV